MRKITIIALHLGYGGIEKAIASLANMLCNDYQVNIISTYRLYENPAFFIDDKVKIEYLLDAKPNKKEVIDSLKKRDFKTFVREGAQSLAILRLRKTSMIDAIKKCNSDVIISTRPFHNELLSKYGKETALKIAWEHSHHNNNYKYINTLIKSCKNIDYLISVSKELNKFYNSKMRTKTICKHISLTLDNIPNVTSKLDKKEITAIGRLSKEKGFSDLIDVFKLVNERYPNWHLNIVGDGMEKDNIKKKIKENNLDEVITMHGFKDKQELNEILLNTSIYVMTSYTESFGLVLIEAMSYGVPCISFDSARGPLEIIDNNVNGYIIKNRDKEEMTNKIAALIEGEDLRYRMGQEAHSKSLQYSIENVKAKWIDLIENDYK